MAKLGPQDSLSEIGSFVWVLEHTTDDKKTDIISQTTS